ncbi:flagellar basal body rod protein FlgB [Paenibacillus agricola]|uniref:Flagellar basal body rod protein FlgB n=1 Tax=Paenibacillus agricola TaxID=2716264 RepID=A0ABX0JJF3_9BACL|nr:flagellar basal body rod protein FlgB [Paenibacillus agricola]NHN35569.1 flagellar basal body rod protein FlgB [Paenibacillus agricola]
MIESRTSKLNESLLDIQSAQNKVIANNIANVDTPHYKSKSIDFQEELRRKLEGGKELAMKRTHAKHLPMNGASASAVPFRIIETKNTVINNNNNNVDIDYEMSNLAKNQLLYNVTVDRVSGHYSKMKKLLQDLR